MVKIRSDGLVEAHYFFESTVFCNLDFVDYPFDKITCPLMIYPSDPWINFKSGMDFNHSQELSHDVSHIHPPFGFRVVGISEMEKNIWHRHNTGVNINLELKRNFTVIHKIIASFLASAVVLGMFGPLSANKLGIVSTKLISLTLASGGLIVFALHNPDVIKGRRQPNFGLSKYLKN